MAIESKISSRCETQFKGRTAKLYSVDRYWLHNFLILSNLNSEFKKPLSESKHHCDARRSVLCKIHVTKIRHQTFAKYRDIDVYVVCLNFVQKRLQ